MPFRRGPALYRKMLRSMWNLLGTYMRYNNLFPKSLHLADAYRHSPSIPSFNSLSILSVAREP